MENNKEEQIIPDTPSEEHSIAENAPILFATCPKCGLTDLLDWYEKEGELYYQCQGCKFESLMAKDFISPKQKDVVKWYNDVFSAAYGNSWYYKLFIKKYPRYLYPIVIIIAIFVIFGSIAIFE